MSPKLKLAAWFGGTILVLVAVWSLFAWIQYEGDAPAREYAEVYSESNVIATSTTSEGRVVVAQPNQIANTDNQWSYFFWGYMLRGLSDHGGYNAQRTTTNNNYYGSTQYKDIMESEAAWGSDTGVIDDSWTSEDSGSWGSDYNWSSDDSGSWGDSWDSGSDSSSWGSDSSWDSYDSGSWGSDSSWGSGDSGSWGD